MMASVLPLEAKKRASGVDIPPFSAATKATSELNGKMVAAKNAHKKRVISMRSALKMFGYF